MARTNAGQSTTRVIEIAKNLNTAGVPPDFGPENSRLLIQVWRALAKGQPIAKEHVDQIAMELGISSGQAEEFLRQVSERDNNDNIIGLVGLSLSDAWVHRFNVNGVSLRTWCAWDALFLPPMLKQTVTVESESPSTGNGVSVIVTPENVENSNPTGVAVSIVTVDPRDTASVEAIWSNFCHQVYFFPSRDEAELWAEGKENIAILSVEEAYELGKLAFSKLLEFA